MSDEENRYSNFGYRKIDRTKKVGLVSTVFSNVAPKYDLMNDIMSLGIHRLWKEKLISYIPNIGGRTLDMGGGTGDIAFKIHNKASRLAIDTNLVLADPNENMIHQAKDKATHKKIFSGIEYMICTAEDIPFEDNSFDYYVISFGIRNVTDIDLALREAYRVLKPTGKFLCLEFSKITLPVLHQIYKLYSMNIIPQIGKYIAGDEEAYRYLAESIDLFPDQQTLKSMIFNAGFDEVKYENLAFGTAAIHSAYKF